MNEVESWEDLLSLLRAERTTYQRLSLLLAQELEALRSFSDQTLLELAEKKKPLLTDLRNFDQRRMTLLVRVLGPLSSSSPEDWLRQLSQSPSPWGPQAFEEFEGILAIAKTVAQQGRHNAELTHRGISMVREALRLIYSGGDVEQPVYHGRGTLELPMVTSSLSVHG